MASTTAGPAPVADWINIPDLYADPYPAYERLRRESPVAYVPSVGRYFVTTFDLGHHVDTDQETFTADEDNSLQKIAMGHSMLRKDDPQHAVEREVWQPVLKPRAIKAQWQQVFEANAAKYLEEFRAIGTGADLIKGFAAPYAAENLRIICGFENATQEDLQRWSQTMIDGTGNYANDPEIWAKSKRSYDEVDIALDEMLAHYKNNPNGSLISGLANSTGYQMPIESMRANLKMTIGGGLNEPRDVLGVTAWALMERPEQLADVMADQTLWPAAFEESIRWISPIGFYPRQTTRDVELGGVMIPKGAKVGVSLLSANRDETRFPESSVFNIHREKIPHLAFGTGSHYCAGAWVAKASVAGVGLPTLFNNLKNLRLDPENPAQIGGWVFRGMLNLPVLWD